MGDNGDTDKSIIHHYEFLARVANVRQPSITINYVT